MKKTVSAILVFLVAIGALCAPASASGRRLPEREMKEIEKVAVVLDYWGLDGGDRRKDLLYLHKPPVYRGQHAVSFNRQDFLRKLTALGVKRDTVLITVAVTVEPIPDSSLDEVVRFFQRSGFHRVMIFSGEGVAPKGAGPLILRDCAARR